MPVRVAIYARYSTDLQSERSIEDQVALARRIIRAEGLIEAGVFADRIKTSATLVGRSGLTDLMKAVESGNVDVVLVEHLDGISRDQADLATIYKKLKFHGVMLREVHGGEANAITVGVRGLMGSLFLTDLKDKVRRGTRGKRHPWHGRWRQSLWLPTCSGKAWRTYYRAGRGGGDSRDLRALSRRRDA